MRLCGLTGGGRMRFGILGPLVVDDGAGPVGIPGGRQRALLAALLVHAGHAVSAEALAEVVWGGSPPPSATDTLRTHVMRLRRALGPRVGARLVTRYPGYLLEASEDEVDLLRFGRLCRDGGAALRACAWLQASQILAEALGLWRGAALADVPSQVLQRDEVPRLDQLRLQAREWQVDANLQLGRHVELVTEMRSLAAEYPLHERFHAQLMLALYRCGRQGEALAAYQRAREVLVEELGAEPGSELRTLHQQILTTDPALELPKLAVPEAAVAEHAARPASGRSEVPRQLPGPVRQFVGRDTELAALAQVLEQAAHAAPAVVISAIGGTAGVGKTTLAVHWAHQVADRFPDGQLYANLRGYDPGQPVTAADALAGFLRALGVGGQDIPVDEDERAARYRSLLAGQKMLIVLDNARDVAQVRPLLPGSPGCAVLVTSRDALAGLVARDGATRLALDLLPLQDAIDLLRQLIGGRADADPPAVEELAAQCCRLPLALRVAAEFAAARPGAPLQDLVAELSDQRRRLNLLDAGGDPRTAVRAVFSWSYNHLDAGAARAFRLAGLHPGPDFDRYALAAITGTTADQAQYVLDVLARAHLIQSAAAGRHAMHDLLRAYARELASSTDGEQEEHAALTRLLDHCLHTASVAIETIFPEERHKRPSNQPPATPGPSLADPSQALGWLDAERATLVAVIAHAAGHGWASHATRIAAVLYRYLDTGGHYPEAIRINGHAYSAALDAGDSAAEVSALNSLGTTYWRQGHYRQATDHLEKALARCLLTGDLAGQASALNNLGLIDFAQSSYQRAAGRYRQALLAHRETGNRTGQAAALNGLGNAEEHQGHYQQARKYQSEALALSREAGYRVAEAWALNDLGVLDRHEGCYEQAAENHQQALDIFREIGDRVGEAYVLTTLGLISQHQGRYQQAAENHQQALELFQKIGERAGEAGALNGLGEVFLADGRPGDARAQHAAALSLASHIDHKYEQARAHNGLGDAYHATGELGEARPHWQQALTLYTQLGAPEADEIRARLAAAGERALAD